MPDKLFAGMALPELYSAVVGFPRVLIAGLLLAACASEPPPGIPEPSPTATAALSVTFIDPPAREGALAANFARSHEAVLLTWLEPTANGHAFYLARLEGQEWSAPQPIASGDTFFANWADLPQAAESANGATFAHWLAKLGQGTYAYGVQLARSRDGGTTWEELGLLHDDASPTEHGFVSYAALPEGDLQAFWLDGRAMATGGAMHLRTTRLGTAKLGGGELGTAKLGGADLSGSELEPSSLLDDRVCECCATDAALTTDGPVVVYRDRGPSEIRDIAVVRATGDGWSEPVLIHDDGWQIHGCPVNGPAIAADGERVAVAWFTAAEEQAKVQVVHSSDGGATFGAPVLVDADQPLGRVGVVMTEDGDAVVSWLGHIEGGAEIRWRRIPPGGEAGAVRVVTATTASRAAGVPRMIRRADELLFVWVEEGEPSRLRAGLVPLS